MSNLVRPPRGRRPAAVYWRRRIVMLAVVGGLVVALVVLTLSWSGGSDADTEAADPQAADTQAADPQPSATTEPTAGATAQPSPDRAATRRAAKQRVTTRLRPPRGSCDPADVVVIPDVVDTDARGPVPLRLGVSTTARRACELRLSSERLAMEITSGDDLIWRSSSCPDVLDPQTVTLRPGWLSYLEVTWSGRRATDDCSARNDFAEPGYYWAEAAVIGGEPARGQFRLDTPPPPPPPSKQPKTDDADQPGENREPREDGSVQDDRRAEGDGQT